MYFLDGDPVTARASITERESSGGLLYEPMLADGTSLGVYDDVQVASEAAAYVIDTTHCIHCQRPIAQDDHPGGPRLVHPDLVDGAIDDPNDGTRCGKEDRKSTRLNSTPTSISYAAFSLKTTTTIRQLSPRP